MEKLGGFDESMLTEDTDLDVSHRSFRLQDFLRRRR